MVLLSTSAASSPIVSHAQLCSARPGLQNLVRPNCSCQGLLSVIKSGSFSEKRQGLQIWMQRGAGFGQQRTEVKTKHKLITLDPSKVEEVQTFAVFARKLSQGEPISKWESVGVILLQNQSDLETALKERRKKLLAAAKHQYPSFLVLNTGEELQYGFRKADEEKSGDENKDGITVVDVRGKEPDSSIPALLRADDGTKTPSKLPLTRN